MEVINVPYGEYIITTDKKLLDTGAACEWLSKESYWSKNIPFDVVQRAFDNSYVIGILHDNKQIGYGRLITDYATFAWLADVYILEEHRGKGLSKKMMAVLMEQEWIKKLRNIGLGTLDAHGLYEQFGFKQHEFPDRLMFITRRDIYNS